MDKQFIRVCKCENCKEITRVNDSFVLTSLPPKHYYMCEKCKHSGYVCVSDTFIQEVKDTHTIIINLFGGPGIGKSTIATYLFSKLKTLGYDVEYVSEFAKEKVWENSNDALKNQFYITGVQSWMVARCINKVDVIITDSPILLGKIYCKDNPLLKPAIEYEFNKYNNLNILIKRENKNYTDVGRVHSLNESIDIDKEIIELLKDYKYLEVNNSISYDDLVEMIIQELAKL